MKFTDKQITVFKITVIADAHFPPFECCGKVLAANPADSYDTCKAEEHLATDAILAS